jgi:hypothetical protein
MSKNPEQDSIYDHLTPILKNAFLQFPLLGQALYRHLSNDLSITNKNVQLIITDIISDLLDKQQYDEVHNYIPLLHPGKKEDAKLFLHHTFNTLIEREHKPNELTKQEPNNSKNLYTYHVLSALLASDSSATLVDIYHALRYEQYTLNRKQKTQEESKSKQAYQDLTALVSNAPLFWHHFYHFVQANDIHFAEYIILRCLDLLQQRQYTDAVDLLKPFQPLTPLIILLAWDKYKEDMAVYKDILAPLWEYQSVGCLFFH